MTVTRPWLFGGARLIVAAVVAVTAGDAFGGGTAEDALDPNPGAAAGFNVSAGSRSTAVPRATAVPGGASDPGGTADPSVTVDLSVIDDQSAGSGRRSLARPGGLLMPKPGVFPQSQLHEPDPGTLPYGTLTPPRQRAVNLRPPGSKRRTSPPIRALALTDPTPPPRPRETTIPEPQNEVARAPSDSELTSIGREPRAVEAPSRTGTVVGPVTTMPQTLGPDDSEPLPPPAERPGEPETVAGTDPGTDPATSSMSPMSPLSPELVEPSGPPPPTERALAGETEQPPLPAERKTVALQPASRGEQASLPLGGETLEPRDVLRVEFEATETNLTGPSRAELRDLAERLRSQENVRVQLLAYAEGEGLSPSKARRMSLSRALSVRSYLIENGVKTGRIDVRALGNKAPSAPLDRVDVKVVPR